MEWRWEGAGRIRSRGQNIPRVFSGKKLVVRWWRGGGVLKEGGKEEVAEVRWVDLAML